MIKNLDRIIDEVKKSKDDHNLDIIEKFKEWITGKQEDWAPIEKILKKEGFFYKYDKEKLLEGLAIKGKDAKKLFDYVAKQVEKKYKKGKRAVVDMFDLIGIIAEYCLSKDPQGRTDAEVEAARVEKEKNDAAIEARKQEAKERKATKAKEKAEPKPEPEPDPTAGMSFFEKKLYERNNKKQKD